MGAASGQVIVWARLGGNAGTPMKKADGGGEGQVDGLLQQMVGGAPAIEPLPPFAPLLHVWGKAQDPLRVCIHV